MPGLFAVDTEQLAAFVRRVQEQRSKLPLDTAPVVLDPSDLPGSQALKRVHDVGLPFMLAYLNGLDRWLLALAWLADRCRRESAAHDREFSLDIALGQLPRAVPVPPGGPLLGSQLLTPPDLPDPSQAFIDDSVTFLDLLGMIVDEVATNHWLLEKAAGSWRNIAQALFDTCLWLDLEIELSSSGMEGDTEVTFKQLMRIGRDNIIQVEKACSELGPKVLQLPLLMNRVTWTMDWIEDFYWAGSEVNKLNRLVYPKWLVDGQQIALEWAARHDAMGVMGPLNEKFVDAAVAVRDITPLIAEVAWLQADPSVEKDLGS